MLIFSYPSVLTYVLGAQKNRLIETVLLSTHNICFGWEIRKLNFCYALLTKVLYICIYTMHNKFSNCFVWVSPSTSELKVNLLSLRYKRRSSDKVFHFKKYRITKRNGRAKSTFNFKTSGSRGYFWSLGEAETIFKRLFGHWKPKKHSKCSNFLNFLREIKDEVFTIWRFYHCF